MIVIAMETSGQVGSVALARDDGLIDERVFEKGLRHGTDLIPTLDDLFTKHHLDRDDVGLIAVSVGPGSYTGLRVGIATAKALSFALDVPLVGVPAPDAMVRNLEPRGGAWVLINARREHLYLSEYRAENGQWQSASDHQVIPIEQVVSRLKPDVMLLGDGVPVLAKALDRDIDAAPEDAWIPRARFIASLGFQHWRTEHHDERLTVEPLYLRLSEAEETWQKKRG